MQRQKVHVTVDRPLGSHHPKYRELIYKVNYGYVPGVIGGDGEEQDAYILGIDVPLTEFEGVVIAVVERRDDNETKWIVVPENTDFTDREILNQIHFQEKFFSVNLVRTKERLP